MNTQRHTIRGGHFVAARNIAGREFRAVALELCTGLNYAELYAHDADTRTRWLCALGHGNEAATVKAYFHELLRGAVPQPL